MEYYFHFKATDIDSLTGHYKEYHDRLIIEADSSEKAHNMALAKIRSQGVGTVSITLNEIITANREMMYRKAGIN